MAKIQHYFMLKNHKKIPRENLELEIVNKF